MLVGRKNCRKIVQFLVEPLIKKQSILNCTPKVRQKKSNFWGVFIMKLTYEDKVQIYELRKQGESFRATFKSIWDKDF